MPSALPGASLPGSGPVRSLLGGAGLDLLQTLGRIDAQALTVRRAVVPIRLRCGCPGALRARDPTAGESDPGEARIGDADVHRRA